jgi:endogenous inhibitor of DNA gyrase (YacG/DUF329 family)
VTAGNAVGGRVYSLRMRTYACVICKRTVQFEGKLPPEYPFCSERCRMIDLGLWFREAYSIDRDLTPEDLSDSARLAGDQGEPRSG